MAVRALRGATTVDADSPDEVKKRTADLLSALLERNGLDGDALISIFLTSTSDLSSVAPAAGIREFGLVDVPLICVAEMMTDGALPRCIRLMAHVETELERSQVRHVFLRDARSLRPDLVAEDDARDAEEPGQ